MATERIFARNQTVSNDTWVTGLNNNDLIIGPSGAGKTTGYVIPNVMRFDGSMIIGDTKGNLARKLGPALRERGYEVQVLDFINPENSCAYNPLDYIRRDGDGRCCEQDILSIASALVPPMGRDEAFWIQSAQQVVTSLIAFAMEALPAQEQNLGSVLELFRALTASNNGQFFGLLETERPDSFAVKKYRMYANVMTTDRTWGCITQFASQALDVFDFREVQAIFHRPAAFRIEEMGERKIALFLNISDVDRTFDRLVNVFYTQALQVLCRSADRRADSRLAVPVRIMLDDFASNAYIPDFDKIISVIRSREISVSVMLQSLSQLDSLYGQAAARTILNNCDHILYLGGQDLETTNYISRRADRSPQSILNMPLDSAYLFTRGEPARLVEKLKPFDVRPDAAEAAL